MANDGGHKRDGRDRVDAILSRAKEMANSDAVSDQLRDAEILAGIQDGILSVDSVDETSLERFLHLFGVRSVLEAFLERAEALEETEAELSISRILSERGSQSVRQIMTERGLRERDESQRPHIYTPQLPPRQTLRQLLGDLFQFAFGGSTKRLAPALSTKKASPEELEAIEKPLERLPLIGEHIRRKRTSVLLADDHDLFIAGLAHLLRQDFDVVGVARDGQKLVEMAKQHRPDVIVTDISNPRLNGVDAARIVRKEVRSARLIFLTRRFDLPIVEEAIRVGASGFGFVLVKEAIRIGLSTLVLLDGADEFMRAIQKVAKGGTYIPREFVEHLCFAFAGRQEMAGKTALTSRQRQVLQLLAEGKTMKEAAALMEISTRTAESHKYEIMRKLGVETTAALIRYALKFKLV